MNCFHFVKRKLTGVKIVVRKVINGADIIEKFSAFSFATLFGVISPKSSTTTATKSVAMVGPFAPNKSTQITVTNAVTPIFTILLPTRIVVRSLS